MPNQTTQQLNGSPAAGSVVPKRPRNRSHDVVVFYSCLSLFLLLIAHSSLSYASDPIFSDSLPSNWRVLFGSRQGSTTSLTLAPTSVVPGPEPGSPIAGCHVELQRNNAIGTDFTY